jgi:hypothetical protein
MNTYKNTGLKVPLESTLTKKVGGGACLRAKVPGKGSFRGKQVTLLDPFCVFGEFTAGNKDLDRLRTIDPRFVVSTPHGSTSLTRPHMPAYNAFSLMSHRLKALFVGPPSCWRAADFSATETVQT